MKKFFIALFYVVIGFPFTANAQKPPLDLMKNHKEIRKAGKVEMKDDIIHIISTNTTSGMRFVDNYDFTGYNTLRITVENIHPTRPLQLLVEIMNSDITHREPVRGLLNRTFTIMGDVSQNINLNSGLGDWESLKKLMLPDKYDAFGLLRKSYRNTVEISKFATDILKHGNFPIYPVEPIVRHGEDVSISKCKDNAELIDKLVETLKGWQKKNYETIAVITKDIEESHELAKILNSRIKVKEFSDDDTDFGAGVMIIPIEYSKGLEFDAVIIYDASKKQNKLL